MLGRVVANIDRVQNFLKRPLVIENISAYREHPASEIPEPEFLNLVARKSGCRLLLDINNIYVNAANFRFNARRFVRAIDPAYVAQYHLAGYTDMETHLFDTHAERVHAPVARLFREARFHLGERRFSLERDDRIPAFQTLLRETQRLAALKPVRMPARFDIPTATELLALRSSKSGQPTFEQKWQREFYSAATLRGETRCGLLTPRAAQQVYRNAYMIRLTQALQDKYPLLWSALGEKQARSLQKKFVSAHDSSDEDLGRYGNNLPQWLGAVLKRSNWSDLAALELLLFEIFHSRADKPVRDIFSAPVVLGTNTRIWSSAATQIAVRRGRAVALAKRKPVEQHALCYRDEFAAKVMLLTAGQRRFVAHLTKPVLLTGLLERADRENWLPPQEVQQLFQVLGITGVLTCRQTNS